VYIDIPRYCSESVTRVAPFSDTILIERLRPEPIETFRFDVALPLVAGEVARTVSSAQPLPRAMSELLKPRPAMRSSIALAVPGSAEHRLNVPWSAPGGVVVGGVIACGTDGNISATAGGIGTHGSIGAPSFVITVTPDVSEISIPVDVVIVVLDVVLVLSMSSVWSKRRAAPLATWPHVLGTLVAHNASAAAATLHASRLLLRGLIVDLRP
jgi:hypothetical protein